MAGPQPSVFGRENKHLFMSHIVGFIPRTCFEFGEGKVEEEKEDEVEELDDEQT
jgi:hypothetical protein